MISGCSRPSARSAGSPGCDAPATRIAAVSTPAISSPRAACGVHEVKAAGRRADLIHVDVMHDHLLPPLAIGPVVAAGRRRRADRSPHADQVVSPEVLLGAA